MPNSKQPNISRWTGCIPLIGFVYGDDCILNCKYEGWGLDGRYTPWSDCSPMDIVGMWEESLEGTIRKAYSDGLPLRTRGGDKVYIVQIAESDNPLIKEQPVFGVYNEVSSLRWKLNGSYLLNGEETPYDIVGLWKEE